ncbi:uncharacterized protein LOC110231248 isoform X2 [Exaiptasia diaphana]|uniref:Uncharacterized protein n=1 Tax=Exaiptasia diaphana TaxID=2652724 RepID=A0A913YDD1_EXADI|nr:uncharacterized protein LOC110231248 isoform X2 [Exaiptasia diaphana]
MKMKATVPKVTLWTINSILALAGLVVMNIYVLRTCKQCVFFGHIQEVERIFTSGSMIWCMFIMSGCFVSFGTGLVVLLGEFRKFKNVMSFFNQSSNFLILRASLLWTFLAAIVSAVGFFTWCQSFKVNSCFKNASQDWHAFTPKHSDCFGASAWQILLNVFLWGSFLLQSLSWFHYL